MKRIILLLLLLSVSFIFISCNTDEDNEGTHNQAKPMFILDALRKSGYVTSDKPLTVTFIIDENTIQGDKPYKFLWDFGDGSEIQEINKYEVVHEYTEQGIYTVKVTMLDNDYVSETETPDEFYTQEVTILAKSKVDLVVQLAEVNKFLFRNNTEGGDEGLLNIKVANLGSDTMTDSTKIKAYLSENQTIETDTDILLGETELEPLELGTTTEKTINFRITEDITPGNYWIIIKIDPENNYIESNEGNNTYMLSSPIDILGANSNSPDLTFDSVEVPDFFIVNDPFTVTATIKNTGEGASLPFSYKLVLSKDETLDTKDTPEEEKNDIILKYDYVSESISPNDSLTVKIQGVIQNEGDYYLFLILDATNDIAELDETNNIYKSEKIKVGQTLTGVDLVPYNPVITPLTGITKGRTLSVTYTIKNRGDHPAFATNARVFISKDKFLDENDRLLPLEGGDDGEISPIVGGAEIERTHRIKIPEDEDFEEGKYYILIDINYIPEGESQRPIEEVDYTNNTVSSRKITVEGSSSACSKDIVINNVEVLPSPAFEGSPFTLKFDISNQGTEEVASFVTKIYAGLPGTDIDDDNYLKKNYNFSRLSPGSMLTKKITLEIPNHLTEDRYCILIKADATNTIGECDEQNNIINYCFDVLVRGDDNDITVSDLELDNTVFDLTENDKLTISFKASNLGTTNTATFYCKAYFSPDEEFSSNDFEANKSYTIYNLSGGEEQEITDYEVTIPDNMGNREYKVFLKCDDTRLVPETDEDNNVAASDEKIKLKGSAQGCNADAFEINDTRENASLIDLSNDVNARICDQDMDWYVFDLNKTHKFRIDLQQGIADKDIDLTLYKENTDGELIEMITSASTEKREKIEKNILTDEDEGRYYLKVYPKNYSTMTKTDYTLQIAYEEVGGDGVDLTLKDVEADEINNIMTGESFDLNFKVENLKSNPSGSFVIGIYLSSDREVSADDTILSIVNSQSLNLLENRTFENSLTLGENLPSGQYYLIVKIDPYDSIEETDKTNNTYLKQVMVNYNSTCELDALEPNSWEPLQGKVVSNGTYPALKLCKDDADVYLVYLEKNTTFHANILFTDAEGDIEVRLYKPNDTSYSGSVASSTSSTDNEEITYTAEQTGFYILKIYKSSWGGGSDPQTYSMELSGITQGYNFVNNNLQILSANLSTDENVFFKYKITSESTQNLMTNIKYNIYISEDPLLSDDDQIIYSLDIDALEIGASIDERVKVRLPANLNTGNYYFISKVDAEDQIEELKETDNMQIVIATVVGNCRDDIFESNNSMLEADRNDSIVQAGLYENLTICPTDRDYYKIFLPAGKEVFINIYFTDPIGDLDLLFYSPSGELLAESSSETDNEHIRYSIVDSGWYYIRVDGVEYDTNAYNLEILLSSCEGVECNNGSCVIDDHGATSCECDEGYGGNTCNECLEGYHRNDNGDCVIDEVCDDNSCTQEFKNVCTVSHGYVVCSCNDGYTENNDGNCIINCDASSHLVPNDTNDDCICENGYHLDGDTCVIDETCDPNPCTEQNKTVCNIVNGVAECSCDNGYHLDDNNNCIAN